MTARERISYTAKAVFASALYYTGLLTLWQRTVLRRKAVVVMYHRVLSPSQRMATASHPGIVVDEATFARHMALLKRNFRVLSLDEFAHRLSRRVPFESSSCLITFDDGWRDNFENALPHLVHHGLPAVVFLPTDYIGRHRPFWQEALTYVLSQATERVRDPGERERWERILSGRGLADVLRAGGQGRRGSIGEIVRAMKHTDVSAVEAVLAELAAELGIDVAQVTRTDGFMTWDEVREMFSRGVAFGGHGADHRILSTLPLGDAEAQILASKESLDSHLSQGTMAFAYPNGDWDPQVATAVKKAGFGLAFTTVRGFVRCDDDPFTLRRVNLHEDMTDSIPMFLARVTGLL